MRSLSEIETVSKRASRAAGFSWGEAEEIGKNIRLLELFGLPGIKNLNLFLSEKKNNRFENLNLISETNKSNKNHFCPISTGISFLDQIDNLKDKIISINNIAYPILFIPFLSRSSEIVGKRIKLKFDQAQIILNFNVNIYSDNNFSDLILKGKDVEISFLENTDSFSEDEWKNLYKLSEDTFVEESESLKQGGAGAGLTDND